MDPFATNNQPTPGSAQMPPQYNPFGETAAAPQQAYNPYAQQQQFQQPQFGGAPAPGGPQQFYNPTGAYQNTNVAFNPNTMPPPPGQFQQPNLVNAPPPAPAAAERPFNQYKPPEPHTPIQPTSKFWTIQFYQQYFDVDTRQVLLRMGNTLLPITCPDFLSDLGWHWNQSQNAAENGAAGAAPATHGPSTSGQNGGGNAAGIGAAANNTNSMFETANGVLLNKSPDLYGPFWICTTLWMLTAIIGNILSKISNMRTNSQKEVDAHANGLVYSATAWNYDFTQATIAMGTVYLYVVLMGLLMWGISRWKELPIQLSHCLCTYGYSMFIFILVSILCIIPVGFLQWLACMIGCLWSAAYIILNFWFVWRNALNKQWFIGVLAIVLVAHVGLGMAFRFYFFNYDL